MHSRVARLEQSFLKRDSSTDFMEVLADASDDIHVTPHLETGLQGIWGDNLQDIVKSIAKNKWDDAKVLRTRDDSGKTLRIEFSNQTIFKITKTGHKFNFVKSYFLSSHSTIKTDQVVDEFMKALDLQQKKISFDADIQDITAIPGIVHKITSAIPRIPDTLKVPLIIPLYAGAVFEVQKSADGFEITHNHWAVRSSDKPLDYASMMDVLSIANDIARNSGNRS